jgi:hypothetical protein
LTLILILLAGILDLGRAYYSFLALKNAAAEGAAYASIAPTDNLGIEARTKGESPTGVIDWTHVQVDTAIIGHACRGGTVKVEAVMEYVVFTPFIGSIIGSQSFPLKAEVVNTILSPACP